MRSYAHEILNGISKVPTPNYPGNLIVSGEAQAVLTGKTSSEVVIAACCYGQGRIIVTTHDCYLDWICEPDTDLKRQLSRGIKTWLSGQDIPSTDIINFQQACDQNMIKQCRVIKWHHDFDPNDNDERELLSWIQNGGGLLCGSTPWGYLSIHKTKTLDNMALHCFLKKYAGITFLPDSLFFGEQVDVTENKARFSNFDMMLDEVCSNTNRLSEYVGIIETGLDNLMNSQSNLDLNKIKKLKDSVTRVIRTFPTESTPVKDSNEKSAVRIVGKCMFLLPGERSPNCNDFPGDFQTQPQLLQNIRVKVDAKFEYEWVSTGYYLPPGVMINVIVNSSNINGWSIRIGCHSRFLDNCAVYKRWYCITSVKKLTKQMNFSSPFGGLVYFQSGSISGSFEAVLSNVVESPYIDLTKPETVNNWNNRRNSPGLWAELVGENVIFSTPSSCVRHIQNPSELIKFWDRIVETHHELRGTSPRNQKRERVVNDRQLFDGAYMHSGYPIMTGLDCVQPQHHECIFDLNILMNKGNWGLFHEFGHNMQRPEWVFDGSTETTVNIFSMHAYYKLLGKDILDISWPRNQMTRFSKYFLKQPTYQNYKEDPGMGLMVFAQLIKHFGWQPMQKFMKDYENDIKNGQNLPKNNQEKIDQWVIRYSRILSKNIRLQFEMYGLPVSRDVDQQLWNLQSFCPYEERDANVFFDKMRRATSWPNNPSLFSNAYFNSAPIQNTTWNTNQNVNNNTVSNTDRFLNGPSYSDKFLNSQNQNSVFTNDPFFKPSHSIFENDPFFNRNNNASTFNRNTESIFKNDPFFNKPRTHPPPDLANASCSEICAIL